MPKRIIIEENGTKLSFTQTEDPFEWEWRVWHDDHFGPVVSVISGKDLLWDCATTIGVDAHGE